MRPTKHCCSLSLHKLLLLVCTQPSTACNNCYYLILLVVGSTYRRPACDFLPGAAYVMSMSISMPPSCKHEHTKHVDAVQSQYFYVHTYIRKAISKALPQQGDPSVCSKAELQLLLLVRRIISMQLPCTDKGSTDMYHCYSAQHSKQHYS
jgi:hypothetical protein